MSKLIDLANQFEREVLNLCKQYSSNFYKIWEYEEYPFLIDKLTSSLTYVGGGHCCNVWTDNTDFVLKLHRSDGQQINLLAFPSPDWEAFGAEYYLAHTYTTSNGYACVQPLADCTESGQEIAYQKFKTLNEMLVRQNHRKNMGLFKGHPVYVDWF